MTNDSMCAVCGEHANEHGAIPHQFVARSNEEMFIYMIREDSQDRLWKAPTMHAALELAEADYVQEQIRDKADGTEAEWRRFYRRELVEQCQFIGELVNP